MFRNPNHRSDRRPGDRAADLRAQAAARLGQAARPGHARVQGLDHRARRRRGRRAARDRASDRDAGADRAARRAAATAAPGDAAERESTEVGSEHRSVAAAIGRSSAMAQVLRPIGHEDRLSIVDHLDELRSRLIVCGVVADRRVRLLLLAEPRAAAHPQPGAAVYARAPPTSTASRPSRPRRSRSARRSPRSPRARPRSPPRRRLSAADRRRPPRRSRRARAEAAKALPSTAPDAGEADHDRGRRAVHDDAHRVPRTSRCCSRSRSSSTRATRS